MRKPITRPAEHPSAHPVITLPNVAIEYPYRAARPTRVAARSTPNGLGSSSSPRRSDTTCHNATTVTAANPPANRFNCGRILIFELSQFRTRDADLTQSLTVALNLMNSGLN